MSWCCHDLGRAHEYFALGLTSSECEDVSLISQGPGEDDRTCFMLKYLVIDEGDEGDMALCPIKFGSGDPHTGWGEPCGGSH